MNRNILSFLIIFILPLCAGAQDFVYTLSDDSVVNHFAGIKRVYYAVRIDEAPKIDGRLDDECWQKSGTWDGDFIQQVPNQGRAPSQETRIKILYDDNYLYVGIVCYDNEPGKIRKVLGRRDVNNGDVAGIALDTYFDKQTAFEFNVTAAGQKVDLMHLGDYGWDFNWDAVWDGKSSVGDSAWYAEIRIPFNQLRFAKRDEQIWGMHVWRWIDRLNEENHWKLIPIDAPAMVYIFGKLRGIKDISTKRNFELLPYSKIKHIPDAEKRLTPGVGFDGKIGVTSNFTLDYTFNPDFGQVEADPSVLNLTAYEVFYDEKRPFFLEGNNILNYNAGDDLLFYSRRIGAAPEYPEPAPDERVVGPEQTTILNALKLTGKNHSGLSLGVINSMTMAEHATFFSENGNRKERVEPFTNYFIGRVKQDFNNRNTFLGGMATSVIRNIKDDNLKFLPDNSLTGGIDFQHFWKERKYYVDFKGFASKVSGSEQSIAKLQLDPRHQFQRKDAKHLEYKDGMTSLEGWGGQLSGGKIGGKLRLEAELDWRSPGVELNDVGYLWQADYIKQGLSFLYWINKPKSILNSYYVSIDQKHMRSYGGEKLGDEINGHVRFVFKNLWKLDFIGSHEFFNVDTRGLRGGPALRKDGESMARAFIQTNTSRNLILGGGPTFTWNEDKIGYSENFIFVIKWLISGRFNLDSNTHFTKTTDNNQYVFQTDVDGVREYIVGKLNRKLLTTTLRAEIFATPELSFQYYGNPYASVGRYEDFRKVNISKSVNYNERFSPLFIHETSGEKLLQDEKNNTILNLNLSGPDFNFQEFRSNFVARWEYKTGSTLYFVWTNTRTRYQNVYEPSVFESLKGIHKVKAENAFMLKLSFWFSI
jgi:hypothetical protein